jgi:hypothetical protein
MQLKSRQKCWHILRKKQRRHSYGFEIKKDFYKDAKEKMLSNIQFQKSLL